MRILMIDKYYFIKGGAERCFFELKKLLESHGHQVIPFSMKHPKNFPSLYSKYFVENIDFHPSSFNQKIQVGCQSIPRILYSTQSASRIRKLIRRVKPDIAHLHMIDHQLSPSILPVLKEEGIPVVQSIHTYKPVCPSYMLYNTAKGEICEKCIDGSYYEAVINRCHKNSYLASALVALEMYIHKSLHSYQKYIDLYLVPSEFVGNKMKEGGFNQDKIHLIRHFIDPKEYPQSHNNNHYLLYFGRLSAEKGLLTLLKAMEGIKRSRLKIVGDGPMRSTLESYVKNKNLQNIEFVGSLNGGLLKSVIANASFIVLPSEWYENAPMSIYEAFALGKPVIGSCIGGIPELIQHGKDGYLFQSKDYDELKFWINFCLKNKTLVQKMGKNARLKVQKLFNPQIYYKKLFTFYSLIVSEHVKDRNVV